MGTLTHFTYTRRRQGARSNFKQNKKNVGSGCRCRDPREQGCGLLLLMQRYAQLMDQPKGNTIEYKNTQKAETKSNTEQNAKRITYHSVLQHKNNGKTTTKQLYSYAGIPSKLQETEQHTNESRHSTAVMAGYLNYCCKKTASATFRRIPSLY